MTMLHEAGVAGRLLAPGAMPPTKRHGMYEYFVQSGMKCLSTK